MDILLIFCKHGHSYISKAVLRTKRLSMGRDCELIEIVCARATDVTLVSKILLRSAWNDSCLEWKEAQTSEGH